MEDREAIERLRQGDIGGLEPLVRRYQLDAVRAAYAVTRDRGLAEEIVKAAFLRAYERIGQFDASRPFGPWLLRSVINDAIKATSRRERLVSLDLALETDESFAAELLTDPGPGPDEVFENGETSRLVHNALAKLAPNQRAVVLLRYYFGLGDAEISADLGCPSGTVKWRLHRARFLLRRLLAGLLDGGTGERRSTRKTPAEGEPRLSVEEGD